MLDESCQRILSEYRDAAGELTQLQLQPRGTLKINAPMSFGQLQLAPALIEFQRLHPGIAVQLTLTDRFVDIIEEGYDLVMRIGALRGSSLIARRLCAVRRVLCAAPAYLARAGIPARPEELTGHRLLHYGPRRDAASPASPSRHASTGYLGLSPMRTVSARVLGDRMKPPPIHFCFGLAP